MSGQIMAAAPQRSYRSLLFVPGSRPDRFNKAHRAGADLVCLDLEDAVAQAEKPEARKAVLAWLGGRQGGPPAGLRINALHTAAGQADLLALSQSTCSADFVMIPKLRHAAELRLLDQLLPPRAGFLFPLIESPDALEDAYEIAAHPRAECVLFGAVDFAAEAGCDTTWEALLYARSRLACACAAHGATLFDVPYLALDDAQGCETETRRSRALGIRARCAIHPNQIAPIHRALAPSAEEVAHARRVVAAYQSGGLGQLDGALVELPVFKRAQQVLAAAGEHGGS